ncbi:helix-turn-helix domain-containing protein [Streptomyces zingiberis]|uniref:Helix-turn-helix domain-containing protein n=1 Tax=Streptomyces zingiberis TaxID=2053010 RepID=A0ABX1C078_9ACTN|nr:helix-turn-helix transcriptional regulator [Streptomyces zingiberis]NJQ03276.1 helix-turn-helix domain-containing protein [Streptomyces zingiberis]
MTAVTSEHPEGRDGGDGGAGSGGGDGREAGTGSSRAGAAPGSGSGPECAVGKASEPEPTESLRTFGAVVKAFRARARLTQEQFAPLVRYSVQTVASIEQGRRFPPEDFVERAEDVLDGFGALRGAAKHLTRKAGLATWFRQWADIEKDAISLNAYECRVVPGLLQTEAYARAVFRSAPPHLSDERINHFVARRLARQKLLHRQPSAAVSFVIEQAVLERPTGGVGVMREQFDRLIDDAGLHSVNIQIMPLRQEPHAGLSGSMRLAESPQHTWVGYFEGPRGSLLVTDPENVSVLSMRYSLLRTQALTPEDSVNLLKQMRGAL